MWGFFAQMGVIQWPMYVAAIFLVVQIARAAAGTRQGRESSVSTSSVLVWGGLGALLGILGTVVGFSQAAGAIAAASDISPPVIWGGVRVALSTTIFGLMLLTLAVVAWLALQWMRGHPKG